MTRYAVVVMVDSEDSPNDVLHEIVSALEFDHRSTIQSVVVLDEDGEELAVLDRKGEDAVTVKIMANDRGNPPGKLADAELHFTDGPLQGLKLIGFAIWERRGSTGRNVTFPARQYSVNGERRSFALLRPIDDATAQNHIRDLVLEAFTEYEAHANA